VENFRVWLTRWLICRSDLLRSSLGRFLKSFAAAKVFTCVFVFAFVITCKFSVRQFCLFSSVIKTLGSRALSTPCRSVFGGIFPSQTRLWVGEVLNVVKTQVFNGEGLDQISIIDAIISEFVTVVSNGSVLVALFSPTRRIWCRPFRLWGYELGHRLFLSAVHWKH
jgi:hypothetical protein